MVANNVTDFVRLQHSDSTQHPIRDENCPYTQADFDRWQSYADEDQQVRQFGHLIVDPSKSQKKIISALLDLLAKVSPCCGDPVVKAEVDRTLDMFGVV